MAVLFLNGLVLDGLGGLVERGGVLVEGERITAVGAGLENRRDSDTRVIDLGGRTLLPGLIDTHVHIAGGDYYPGDDATRLGLAALRSAPSAERTLMAGVTTIRTAGSRDFLDVDLRDAIDTGYIRGPRVIASGRGITTTGGHLHRASMEVDGTDAAIQAVRFHLKQRVDAIKLMLSYGVATNAPSVTAHLFNIDEVKAVVYEAHKFGYKVITHSIGREAIRNGVEAGVDSIDHGNYLDEELAVKMKEKGIYLVPTFGPFYYYTEMRIAEPWRIARAETMRPLEGVAFRLAMEVGVPIAMGSDCGAPSRFPNGENLLEMELMVKEGMSPERVIVCSTSEAAKLVGRGDSLGSLEPGKLADLVVLEGNPLDDMTVVRRGVKLVMKGGTVYRDEVRS